MQYNEIARFEGYGLAERCKKDAIQRDKELGNRRKDYYIFLDVSNGPYTANKTTYIVASGEVNKL